jgi:cobalt-zinc-cadmium resistance protein CzcA
MMGAGVAGSLMSLGAIDFGLLVDSAIISVENTVRRLHERPDDPVREVVRDAALEVRRPTLFGELVIAIVYLPVLALTGFEGKLFRPMALTVLFALAGSMLLSISYVPAVMSLVFRKGVRHAEPAFVGLLKRAYHPVTAWVIRQASVHGTP